MLYNDINTANIEGINNYIVTIEPLVKGNFWSVGGTTVGSRWGDGSVMKGIMNDKEIELPFGITLTNPGSIEGMNAVGQAIGNYLSDKVDNTIKAGKASKDSDMINRAGKLEGRKNFISKAFSTLQKATGMDLKGMQPQYSVVKPDNYARPSISFKCTFYKGMCIGNYKVESFKAFIKQLVGATFPDEIGMGLMSFLTSPQLSYSTYFYLATVGFTKPGNQDASSPKDFGFRVKVGKLLDVSNVWMKDAKVSIPTIFDSTGQPLVWDVSFEFEYWRQPTYKDIQSWLKV